MSSAPRSTARSTGKREWSVSARRGMYCVLGLALACFVTLEIAYLSSNFDFYLVAQNSSTTTPLFYKFTAIWSSQAGSTAVVGDGARASSRPARCTPRATRTAKSAPWATAVLGVIAVVLPRC